MGLVTVALLTLAPLALRPVRLACLIHAANVHSEPGSNPSKMVASRGPKGPAPLPQRSRVEELLTGRTEGDRRGGRPALADPRCRFRETAPAARTENQAVRGDSDGLSPAPLKGSHSQLDDPRSTELSKSHASPRHSTDAFGRRDPAPFERRSHRPSLDRSLRLSSFSRAARVMITRLQPRSTPYPTNSFTKSSHNRRSRSGSLRFGVESSGGSDDTAER